MGTPDFSVPPLVSLHKHGYNVEAVVTQPDRPKGRGRKVIFSPVKKTAVSLGYEILQPKSIRDDRFADRIEQIAPDILVVVAFAWHLTMRFTRIIGETVMQGTGGIGVRVKCL